MRPRRRGFLIILSLLLITLLLVIVMGFMSSRSLEFSSTGRVQAMAQAQALAEAGMEDARVKLEKDVFFPPVVGFGQSTFTYTEDLADPETNQVLGTYTVTVDVFRRSAPYCVIKVLSVGSAGPRQDPIARYRIYAELDVAPNDRASGSGVNARLFRFVNWQEEDVEPPMPEQAMPQ